MKKRLPLAFAFLLGYVISDIVDLNLVSEAQADDSYVINRILFCIDGSTISGGSLSTYSNG